MAKGSAEVLHLIGQFGVVFEWRVGLFGNMWAQVVKEVYLTPLLVKGMDRSRTSGHLSLVVDG